MKNIDFKIWIEELLKNDNVKSIEVIDWKEMGEYSGDDPRPVFKIEKFNKEELNK